jgi:hypothetical protein
VRRRQSGPPPGHPEAPRNALIVMIEEGSTHEAAVAAAAQAGSLLSLLHPDPSGQGRMMASRRAIEWTHEAHRLVDVRIAPLRHIRRAVDVARGYDLAYEGVHLPGGRAVAFEPLPAFAKFRQVARTAPLVIDLHRDPFAFYEQALAASEGLTRPVLSFSMRESKATAMAVAHAVDAAVTARHHLDTRYEGPNALIDLDHLDRWHLDGFRTEVTFTPANDSGADLAIQIRLRT